MSELGRTVDVQEIEVTAESLIGKAISELDDELPDANLIALVSRQGESQIPEPALQFERGDHLTFVGRHDDVRSAIERCHPRPTEATGREYPVAGLARSGETVHHGRTRPARCPRFSYR